MAGKVFDSGAAAVGVEVAIVAAVGADAAEEVAGGDWGFAGGSVVVHSGIRKACTDLVLLVQV